MFVVERRELGHLIWDRYCQREYMSKATEVKNHFEKYYRSRAKKSYEWRIREIDEAGEKALLSE